MGKDLVHTRLDFIFGLYLIESEGVTVSASDEITENIKMAKRMDEQQHDPTRKRLERPRNQNKIDCRAADFVFELTPSPPFPSNHHDQKRTTVTYASSARFRTLSMLRSLMKSIADNIMTKQESLFLSRALQHCRQSSREQPSFLDLAIFVLFCFWV